ncbi:MAG: DUF99 family protein [Thermoplasmatota archaeon]
MKSEIRILGVDDMPFTFDDQRVGVVGVVMRGNHYIEGVLSTDIEVDGLDATTQLIELIMSSKHAGQLRAVLVDGGALGGFNVVDGQRLHEATDIPVMTVTASQPDEKALIAALQQHFDDWQPRWDIMRKGELYRVPLRYPLYVKSFGLSIEKATDIIKLSIMRGALPEPLRVAHLIATGVKTGESYGRR